MSTPQDTCVAKRQYPDEAGAWDVLMRIRARGQDTERLEPYQCGFCHLWHLGRRECSMTPAMRAFITRMARS